MTYWNKLIFCIKLLLGKVNLDPKGAFIVPGSSAVITRQDLDDLKGEAAKYVIAASYIGGIGRGKDFFDFLATIHLKPAPKQH